MRVSTTTARGLAWGIGGLCLALTVAGLALQVFTFDTHVPMDFSSREANLVLAVVFLAMPVVGALIALRRPEIAIGWILLGVGMSMAVWVLADGWAIYTLRAHPGSLPGGAYMAWVGNWVWIPGWGLIGFLYLLFPEGRLPSPRWRWLAWTLGIVDVAYVVGAMLARGPFPNYPFQANPLGVFGAATGHAGRWVKFIGVPALVALGLVGMAALFVRLSRAHGDERQQLKWLTFASAVVVGGLAAFIVLVGAGVRIPAVERFAPIVAVLLPISAGVAVLKYRLYDIDVVINRTIVYTVLTGVLAAVYFGLVLAFGTTARSITGHRQSPVVTAASTLAVAAMFRPGRRRTQDVIDRRFYRTRYDAARTLEAFSVRLRHETDIDALSSDLVDVVQQTMRPAHVALWLKGGSTIATVSAAVTASVTISER
ncbi:MAG: hypothetical protein M3Q23_13490 [Actinomycetota bacterium]|nr:hypothetical protein [Actinomycetota bacterium]